MLLFTNPNKIEVPLLRKIRKVDIGWQPVISATCSYEQKAKETWSNKEVDFGIWKRLFSGGDNLGFEGWIGVCQIKGWEWELQAEIVVCAKA